MTTLKDIVDAVVNDYDDCTAAGWMPAGLVDFTDLNNHYDANMFGEEAWTAYERETGSPAPTADYQVMVEDVLAAREVENDPAAAAHVAARRYVAAAESARAEEVAAELDRADRYARMVGVSDPSPLHAQVRNAHDSRTIRYRMSGPDRHYDLPAVFADVLESELSYQLRYPLARA